MKKFITFLIVAGWVFTSYSQEVIQLEETSLTFEPTAQVVFEDYTKGVIRVKESYAKQFEKDAVKFLKENFNINEFLKIHEPDKNEEISVRVQSPKGLLMATYDSDGSLKNTYQKFNDIALPSEIRNQLYKAYGNGWVMTENKYVASGREDEIDKETYTIKMKNGSSKEKLKITPNRVTGVAVISNE
ncbi:hypothetical protein MKO06_10625 [Gramella sp. GC03-9]|uniref:Secreted protein n=1 Tax=Christiangramia oceanisediminis TaxID=2920386 RepID=A0A9X2RCU6_9FLAO|nr:hypothetical protein [Gramella oceanisediminis]MCP9200366.1 hypothetical protein [Gramella oceanisediminis]